MSSSASRVKFVGMSPLDGITLTVYGFVPPVIFAVTGSHVEACGTFATTCTAEEGEDGWQEEEFPAICM